MKITATATGLEEVREKFENATSAVHDAIVRTIYKEAADLQAHIVEDKLNGQVLNSRSGRLARSIKSRVEDSGVSVTGIVGTNVEYARIHEYGGTTPAHVIEAVNAQALAFMMGGKQVFAKRVNHPGSRMPERSFLRSALADNADTIREHIREAAIEAMKAPA